MTTDVVAKNGSGASAHMNRRLDLLLMTLAGILIVVLLIVKMDSLNDYFGVAFEHSEWWEVGSILWTALFVIYYFLRLRLTGKVGVDKLVFALLLLGIVGSTVGAFAYLQSHHYRAHFLCVAGISCLFLIIDTLLYRHHTNHEYKTDYLQSCLLADGPESFALALLGIYLFLHWGHVSTLEAFLSGAISFQLLASNVIFVLIQAGVVRNMLGRREYFQVAEE